MEIHPSPQPTSPNSTSSSSSSSCNNNNNNNNNNTNANNNNNNNNNATTPLTSSAAAAPISAKLPAINPKSIDSSPNPTTFIQADTSSFKQVVQMLTGSATTAAKHVVPLPPPPPRNTVLPPKRPAFKLYERRGGLKNLKTISPLAPPAASRSNSAAAASSGLSPRRRLQQPEILSPSVLDFPALALSPVTPLNPDPFNRSPQPNSAAADEERAIAEKGFYLHPSPRGAEPPRLLPLFPVTSPRACPAPAAAAAAAAGSFP